MDVDAPHVPDGAYSDVVPVAEEFRLLDTATVVQLGAGSATPSEQADAVTATKRTRGRPMKSSKKSADASMATTSTTTVTSEEAVTILDDAAGRTNAPDAPAGPGGEWEAQTDTGDYSEEGTGGVVPLTLADCMRSFTAAETLGEKIVSLFQSDKFF